MNITYLLSITVLFFFDIIVVCVYRILYIVYVWNLFVTTRREKPKTKKQKAKEIHH